MALRNLILALVPLAALSMAGCDVDVNDTGTLPEVNVEPGTAPDMDVEPAEVDVETERREMTIPNVDVDIDLQREKVPVPNIDIQDPDETPDAN